MRQRPTQRVNIYEAFHAGCDEDLIRVRLRVVAPIAHLTLRVWHGKTDVRSGSPGRAREQT